MQGTRRCLEIMGGVVAALVEHAFEHLFIECLGWDRQRGTITSSWAETNLLQMSIL